MKNLKLYIYINFFQSLYLYKCKYLRFSFDLPSYIGKKWYNFDVGTVSTIVRFYESLSFPELGSNYLTVT